MNASWGRVFLLSSGMLIAGSQGLEAAQIDRAEMSDIVATALRFLTDVHLESRFSRPVLGVVTVSDTVSDQVSFDTSQLVSGVSRTLGLPVMDPAEDRFCDVTTSRPYWRMKTADLKMSASVANVSEQEARVSLGYTGGTLLSGSTHRTVRLERSPEGWAVMELEPTVLHGSNVGCRPAPPSSMTTEDLVQMLRAAVLPMVESKQQFQPDRRIRLICLEDMFDGWTKEVVPLLDQELGRTGYPTEQRCQAQRRLAEKGVSAEEGILGADILLHHVVFESPDRAYVQILVSVTSPPAQIDLQDQNGLQQCTIERSSEGWRQTSCEPVELRMEYPNIIKDG